MKFGIIFTLLLALAIAIAPPMFADVAPSEPASEVVASEEPIQTHYLSVLKEMAEQTLKFEPPATQIVVRLNSGDTTVRCGDKIQSYHCTSGKPLAIGYGEETPIEKFWVQNPEHKNFRLKIDVYSVYNPPEELTQSAQTSDSASTAADADANTP
jgi:hypothetical protein